MSESEKPNELRAEDAPREDLPQLSDEELDMVRELFRMVRAGDSEGLGRLLQMGLVPNLRDGQGNSLLLLASYNGHYDLTRVLLEHGGDPQLGNDRGQIPLAGAAFKGDLPMAQLLLDYGAEINAASPDGKTPLMFAAMFDRLEIIDLLIAHGADMALQTFDGLTALSLAQAMGAHDAVAKLQALQE
ncbi:ankyrin repeat domain-containing protein [bacterium]|nr:MAG: ankyrin repeat domain-containing protein [bacterium]